MKKICFLLAALTFIILVVGCTASSEGSTAFSHNTDHTVAAKRTLNQISSCELVVHAPAAELARVSSIAAAATQNSEVSFFNEKERRAAKKALPNCRFEIKVTSLNERKGSAYGSENPAKVAINAQAFALPSGELSWRSEYAYTDKPLSENLFILREKKTALFESSNDILKRGIIQLIEEFLQTRRESFLK